MSKWGNFRIKPFSWRQNKQITHFRRGEAVSWIEIFIREQEFSLIEGIVCAQAKTLSLTELQKAEASLGKTLSKTSREATVPVYVSLLAELQECIKKRGKIVK